MAKSFKKERLGGEIQKIVSLMANSELKDPRVSENMISITGVDVSGDGSYATIYLTCFATGDQKERKEQEVLEGLEHCKGVIKKEISKQVKVRHIPELRFRIDKSLETGMHIDELIYNLNKGE